MLRGHHQWHRLAREEGPRGDRQQMDLPRQHVVGPRQLDLPARVLVLGVLGVSSILRVKHVHAFRLSHCGLPSDYRIFLSAFQDAGR